MLHEEVALYKKLTGSNEENIPIMKIGAYLDGYNKGLEDAKPKWIPVSERLPEENGQYIITVKYKHEEAYEDIYTEHGEWDNGKWDMFIFGHCGEVEEILAWMPLPEPYKPQESEVRV